MSQKRWLDDIYDTTESTRSKKPNYFGTQLGVRPSIVHRSEEKYPDLDNLIRKRYAYSTAQFNLRHQENSHQLQSQRYPYYTANKLVSSSKQDPNIFGTPDDPFIVIYFSCELPKVYLISETAIISPSAYYYKRETLLDTITEYFLLFRYMNDGSSLKWFNDVEDFIRFTQTFPRLSTDMKKHFIATLLPYQNMRIIGFNWSAEDRVAVPLSNDSNELIEDVIEYAEIKDEKLCRWIGNKAKNILDSYFH